MAVKTEPGLQARVAKSTAQLRAVLFLLKNNIANQGEQNGKLVFEVTVRAAPCLPLWGRWQPEGLTEEVFGVAFCEIVKQMQ